MYCKTISLSNVDQCDATYLIADLLPKQRRIFPFPYQKADGRVLQILVLAGVDEFDLNEGLDGAAPGLLAVHARAFLLFNIRLSYAISYAA